MWRKRKFRTNTLCCFTVIGGLIVTIGACHESSDKDELPDDSESVGNSDTASDDGAETDSPGDVQAFDPFAPDHIIDVNIEINAEDWTTLRREGRSITSVYSGCQGEYEYTYFDADVTIDGKTVNNIGLRKKGFLGSLSRFRPSLKINFGKFIEGQTYSGMKRMTLNNDRQDPSHTHQVMSYALFSQAGIVAPRANFARVTVNGEDLGIYTHVEAIKKPFLARHFDDDDGNLYEAQVADFSPALVTNYQKKTNQDVLSDDGTVDISDLKAVIDALDADDEHLLESLAQVIDIDNFLTFWAMEVILGHWDGYSGNRNNYYVYDDPSTGLFNFIPWGTDLSFESEHMALPEAPISVYALGRLAYRLYQNLELRKMYHDRLDGLLLDMWDETALLEEVDRIAALTSPDSAALQLQRDFIQSRKGLILDDIANDGPDWTYPADASQKKCRVITDIDGVFSATVGTGQEFVLSDDSTLTLFWEEGPEVLTNLSTAATIGTMPGMGESVQIIMSGLRESGNGLMLILLISTDAYEEGEITFHGFESTAMVFDSNFALGQFDMLGYVGEGSITVDRAGLENGEIVSGRFSGRF